MRNHGEVAAREGEVTALQARVEQLREALSLWVEAEEAHEAVEPNRLHDPDDCDFDRQGGQRDCPRCVLTRTILVATVVTEAALSATDSSAWLAERLDEARREQAETDFDGHIAALEGRELLPMPNRFAEALAARDARVRAEARAAALEEAAKAVRSRVEESDNIDEQLDIIADRAAEAVRSLPVRRGLAAWRGQTMRTLLAPCPDCSRGWR